MRKGDLAAGNTIDTNSRSSNETGIGISLSVVLQPRLVCAARWRC